MTIPDAGVPTIPNAGVPNIPNAGVPTFTDGNGDVGNVVVATKVDLPPTRLRSLKKMVA